MRYSLVAGILGTCLLVGTTLVGSARVAADDVLDNTLDNTLDNAVEKVMRDSFAGATPEHWKSRLEQDEVQAYCSRFRNTPPPEVTERIVALSNSNFQYPADGELLGDWANGERLASSGKGGHIGTIRPDPPGRKRGANCYACHALARSELSAGNLGPSLTDYGKKHGTSPATIRFVYQKIYNAQAFYPCSQMPRFGHNEWLTPEEVADTVAFLLDPQSPVNQ
jgi:sulfur-oxidizing protein SoxX